MLSLLLDENLSPEIVTQMRQKHPDVIVASVHTWQDGRYMAQPDDQVLAAAAAEGLTLVTYDQKTILPVLVQWGDAGIDHAGVIFIDNLTIASRDFGTIMRSLVALRERGHGGDWRNAITYVTATP